MHHPWLPFFSLVAVLLLVDLRLLQRRDGGISVRVAWLWTVFLALLACAFSFYLARTTGKQPAIEFLTGYLIEGSLSIDNLFVFLILFRALHLGAEQQRRVLLWGVLGAIVLRGVLILAGTTLLARFGWVQYAFGALLAVAAVRLLFAKPGTAPIRGPVRWIRDCCMRYGSGNRLALSSLVLIIAAVEATDLIFALDSIPAVLAVTRNSWIAFTSNIFAVLGLRSLYFALSSMLDRFHLLHYGLACILGFVAFKMLAVRWVAIPAGWSLGIILSILAIFALLSKILPEPAAKPA
ncbi:MAG TPA: TerC/Alx family metal homeostasis membrane protein [Acidobacteriaceae bacterium]|jgi:tellurite resistance protein TerC|nr:TerC/Alx family metal homeostasis membrane protein [Acidobacteriaceae bacterium]